MRKNRHGMLNFNELDNDGILFDTHAMFNVDELENTEILFDGYTWKDLSRHDQELIPCAAEFYHVFCQKIKQHNSPSLNVASGCIVDYFSTFSMREGEGEDDLHWTSKLLIAMCSLILLTRNDYTSVLKNEILNVLNAASRYDAEKINEFKIAIESDLTWPFNTQDILTTLEGESSRQILIRAFNHCRRFKMHDAAFEIPLMTSITAGSSGMYAAVTQPRKEISITGFRKGFLLSKK